MNKKEYINVVPTSLVVALVAVFEYLLASIKKPTLPATTFSIKQTPLETSLKPKPKAVNCESLIYVIKMVFNPRFLNMLVEKLSPLIIVQKMITRLFLIKITSAPGITFSKNFSRIYKD